MLIPVKKKDGTVIAEAVVDDDMERLAQFSWYMITGYAARAVLVNGRWRNRLMQHDVLGKPQNGLHTSHLNSKRLDNRRENLRHCTRCENMVNPADGPRRRRLPKSIGLPRGITWNSEQQKFNVKVTFDKKAHHGGRYRELADAEAAITRLRERLGV